MLKPTDYHPTRCGFIGFLKNLYLSNEVALQEYTVPNEYFDLLAQDFVEFSIPLVISGIKIYPSRAAPLEQTSLQD